MRDDPNLPPDEITRCLQRHYGIEETSVQFLPLGHDAAVSVFRADARDGNSFFLKVRNGPVVEAALTVPRELTQRGIPNILSPIPCLNGLLWCALDSLSLILYPFIEGENAMNAGLADEQWRQFGRTLRQVHSSGIAEQFRDVLREEDFSLPSIALMRQMLAVATQLEGVRSVGAPVIEGVRSVGAPSPIAARHATFWIANADRIESLLARAQVLGRQLQGKHFEHILCHSDIHAANILVCGDGRIWLVDWDGPIIAPRERDLLFVVGSKIAGEVTPREEALFFQGYGPVEIDPVALAYFRYERIIEDIGEFGRTIFLQEGISEETRAATVRLVLGCFEPGGDIDRAEEVTLPSFTAT